MSLLKLESELKETEAQLLSYAAENFGEVNEDLESKRKEMITAIETKIENYVAVKERKFFNNSIKVLRERKKELDKAIKKLQSTSEFVDNKLHDIFANSQAEKVETADGIRYIVPTVNVSRSIDTDKLTAKDRKYQFPPLTYTERLVVEKYVYGDIQLDIFYKVMEKLVERITRVNPTVTELPEDHPAIVKRIKPTVKIRKTKPS